jgi:hypothetical protein
MFHDQRKAFRLAVAHRSVSDAARHVSRLQGVSGDDALDDLVRALRDGRPGGPTLVGLRRSLTPFLAWLASHGRAWQDAALEDVTAYLASRPHWSRVTISRHVQCLRSFFRHAAMRGWVRPGLAEMIDAPRLYTHERLPQGPRWSEVQQLRRESWRRRRADPHTRAGVAGRLRFARRGVRTDLDDIDWEHERIHPPRPSSGSWTMPRWSARSPRRSLRYLTRVRPRCASRAVFVTLRRPIDPSLAVVFRRRCASPSCASARPPRPAPRAPSRQRHATARRGFTLKEIGDHLGHTMVRATEIYAKVDVVSLRQVGDVDLASLVAHERDCAARTAVL